MDRLSYCSSSHAHKTYAVIRFSREFCPIQTCRNCSFYFAINLNYSNQKLGAQHFYTHNVVKRVQTCRFCSLNVQQHLVKHKHLSTAICPNQNQTDGTSNASTAHADHTRSTDYCCCRSRENETPKGIHTFAKNT